MFPVALPYPNRRFSRLTVDSRELRALEEVLTRCASTAMVVASGREAVPALSPKAHAAGGAKALRRRDSNGDGRITCRERARHRPGAARASGLPLHARRRRDGVVCE